MFEGKHTPQSLLIPFDAELSLCKSLTTDDDRRLVSTEQRATDRLPGHPTTYFDAKSLASFLENDFRTPRLNQFAPWLWLVATQDSTHISSLTHQIVRGRNITITENPELHLVWHTNRIFIKPLPTFLLSHNFWTVCFSGHAPLIEDEAARKRLHCALAGFLRSYAFLITHESDFSLAQKHGLIAQPSSHDGTSTITYLDLMLLLSQVIHKLPDETVSPRYRFGDLRLSRLNFWAKFAIGRFVFQKTHATYDTYFARFYGPLLFLFATLSILLSSFAMVLTALQCQQGASGNGNESDLFGLLAFLRAAKGFGIAVIVIVCGIAMGLVCLLGFMGMRELVFALKDLKKRTGMTYKDQDKVHKV